MNGDRVPVGDGVGKASVRTDGDGGAGAGATILDTVDDVAVRASGKAGLESRAPALIAVVDDHKTGVASSESNLLRGRGGPVGDVRGLDGVSETDHSGDGSPTMLTVPAVRACVAVTCTSVPIGSAGVPVAELIAGEDSRRAEGMCQNPDMGECVHVVCRGGGQCRPVTLGIVVGDEGVRGSAVAGRIPVGLWVVKGSDAVGLEGGLDVESVLEGLHLADTGVFGRSDLPGPVVIDLE